VGPATASGVAGLGCGGGAACALGRRRLRLVHLGARAALRARALLLDLGDRLRLGRLRLGLGFRLGLDALAAAPLGAGAGVVDGGLHRLRSILGAGSAPALHAGDDARHVGLVHLRRRAADGDPHLPQELEKRLRLDLEVLG
jgi:hypothetical protein